MILKRCAGVLKDSGSYLAITKQCLSLSGSKKDNPHHLDQVVNSVTTWIGKRISAIAGGSSVEIATTWR